MASDNLFDKAREGWNMSKGSNSPTIMRLCIVCDVRKDSTVFTGRTCNECISSEDQMVVVQGEG